MPTMAWLEDGAVDVAGVPGSKVPAMVCPGAMDIPGMELVGAGASPHPARSMPTAARVIGHFRTVITPFLSWVAELSVFGNPEVTPGGWTRERRTRRCCSRSCGY